MSVALLYACQATRPRSTLVACLDGVGELRWTAGEPCRWTAIDTFDRCLLQDGELLELLEDGGTAQLRWRRWQSARSHWIWAVSEAPANAAGLPAGRPRTALETRTDHRALLVLASVAAYRTCGSVHDRDGKKIIEIELWRRTRDDRTARLLLLPLRGYQGALRATARYLAECPEFTAIGDQPPLPVALTQGRLWRGAAPTGPVALEAGMRADRGCKRVLARCAEVMRANEFGVLQDLDIEFLHDFRVALRQTRSLLGQMRSLFPAPRVRRFRRELAWLAGVTSPARDADVYLRDLPGFLVASVGGESARIGPLEDLLRDRRRRAHVALLRALQGSRYCTLIRDWRAFLEEPVPRRSGLPDAMLPLRRVVAARLVRLHRRTLKQGRRIRRSSPPEQLHELRKTCKKLRYVLDGFRSVLSPSAVQSSLGHLKALQEQLGRFNDIHVQIGVLESLRSVFVRLDSGVAVVVDAQIAALNKEDKLIRRRFAGHFSAYDSPRARVYFALLGKETGG